MLRAHHLGRQFSEMQHDVRLMPPEYVKSYVKSHKNGDLDAEAIAEAASRPTMRFAAIKSEEQLDIQTLHPVLARAWSASGRRSSISSAASSSTAVLSSPRDAKA